MVSSLKIIAPEIDSSSSIVARLKKGSIPRFWNQKSISNNAIKALLSYSATI
jgi:hypothetical protein